MKNFLKSLFLTNLLYYISIGVIVCFVLSFVFPVFLGITKVFLLLLVLCVIIDTVLLYKTKEGILGRRDLPERLSNGDENQLSIYLENRYTFPISLEVIDEIPFQFQKRDLVFYLSLQSGETHIVEYQLRPTKRGEYSFGAVNVFVKSPLSLLKRRYKFSQGTVVAVYPSFLQMKTYELMAISNRLTEMGIKKIRKIGHSHEFEQIRQYVQGDDIRTINWNASARKNEMMINTFQAEKAQNVYSLIDKGRVMQMPFEGLSLLDYAINASLVLANIAIYKQDKAGLITFSDRKGQVVLADRKSGQMNRILEVLYKQKTNYLETDYESLYIQTKHLIRQRSLLVLYTNFETVASMRRQLTYFRKLAKEHLLLVVFFENTDLKKVMEKSALNTEEIYLKTIAEKYFYEKHQIIKELNQYGIQALLTAPQNLTVSTINKYLELKSRGMI